MRRRVTIPGLIRINQGLGLELGKILPDRLSRTRFPPQTRALSLNPRGKRGFLVFLADQKFLRWLFESFCSVLGSRQVSAGAYDLLPTTTVE